MGRGEAGKADGWRRSGYPEDLRCILRFLFLIDRPISTHFRVYLQISVVSGFWGRTGLGDSGSALYTEAIGGAGAYFFWKPRHIQPATVGHGPRAFCRVLR